MMPARWRALLNSLVFRGERCGGGLTANTASRRTMLSWNLKKSFPIYSSLRYAPLWMLCPARARTPPFVTW